MKVFSDQLQEIRGNWRDTRTVMDEREERRLCAQQGMAVALENAQKEIGEVQTLSRELQETIQGLKEDHQRLSLQQAEEKKRVTWVSNRVDRLEDGVHAVGEAVRSGEARTHERLDNITKVMENFG